MEIWKKSRRTVWVIVLLGTMALSLVGQVAVLADLEPPSGTALGAYAPEERVEHLTFSGSAPQTTMSSTPTSDFAAEVVRLINQARVNLGLAPYKVNVILTTIAQGHSEYMRDHDCFAHQCPGEPPVAQRGCNAGYGPYGWGECYIGETIAGGYPNAAGVVQAWLDSAGHADILLDGTLREIGVGVAIGGYWGTYITADFGSQPNVLPIFINEDDPSTSNREVTLTLTNENVSDWGGIGYSNQVMISNDPTFPDADWQSYVLRVPWTLTEGNGEKIVYVKYRDSQENIVGSEDDILFEGEVNYDLELGCNSLTFYYEIGQGFSGPTALSVVVENGAGSAPLTWTAQGGANWLDYDPGTGLTPAHLTVSVDEFETDTVGTYQSVITVTSPDVPEEKENVTVTIIAAEEVYRALLPYVQRSGD